MNFKNFSSSSAVVFKKWGRKNFSLFSVIQRVVKISVLSVVYFIVVPVEGSTIVLDTTEIHREYILDEVEVTVNRTPLLFSELPRVLTVIGRQEIEQSPVSTVQDLLEYAAAVDVRQRGAEGVQADISIRGGTFDQTLILLNGVNISDPQTGHHHFNIPVSLSQIERIEILSGAGARIFGPNAFSGAINIVTKQPQQNSLSAQLDAGSFQSYNTNLSGALSSKKITHSLSLNGRSSDGYIPNTDYKDGDLYYSAYIPGRGGQLFFQGGVSVKNFGANSFYSPKYPDQYEKTQTRFSAVKWESSSSSSFHFTTTAYLRRHFDTFMLFRNASPEWYQNHNYHRTDAWGATFTSWFKWIGGKSATGADFRTESIISNVLGEPLNKPVAVTGADTFYSNGADRSISSLFFEHVWQYRQLSINTGAMLNHITNLGWSIFPGLDLSYEPIELLKFMASWNTSLRMPTFTDLYYSGPVNIGNPELKPEKANSFELGVKLNDMTVKGHLMLFHHRGSNLIDWVKEPGESVWHSMNHTSVISNGIDGLLTWNLQKSFGYHWPERLEIGLFFNNLVKSDGSLISYYVLDYLKNKFTFSASQALYKNIKINIKASYQNRMGSYTLFKDGEEFGEEPYLSFWLVDANWIYTYKGVNFNFSVNNLLNTDYFDLGNIVQPGRRIKVGVVWQIKK